MSPGEQHNYLAVRLSRYFDIANEECRQRWAGKDSPSLEPSPDDVYGVDVPGCDMRRLFLAEDPLAAANAVLVQIRNLAHTCHLWDSELS